MREQSAAKSVSKSIWTVRSSWNLHFWSIDMKPKYTFTALQWTESSSMLLVKLVLFLPWQVKIFQVWIYWHLKSSSWCSDSTRTNSWSVTVVPNLFASWKLKMCLLITRQWWAGPLFSPGLIWIIQRPEETPQIYIVTLWKGPDPRLGITVRNSKLSPSAFESPKNPFNQVLKIALLWNYHRNQIDVSIYSEIFWCYTCVVLIIIKQ